MAKPNIENVNKILVIGEGRWVLRSASSSILRRTSSSSDAWAKVEEVEPGYSVLLVSVWDFARETARSDEKFRIRERKAAWMPKLPRKRTP